VKASAVLAANDAHGFFAAADGLVTSRRTLTNADDYRAIGIR
jgi:glycerate-2-kinase